MNELSQVEKALQSEDAWALARAMTKEEMAQILTTDRPRVIVNSVKPNLFQRIINLLLGRD